MTDDRTVERLSKVITQIIEAQDETAILAASRALQRVARENGLHGTMIGAHVQRDPREESDILKRVRDNYEFVIATLTWSLEWEQERFRYLMEVRLNPTLIEEALRRHRIKWDQDRPVPSPMHPTRTR
jgi:hypothetical protein